MADPAELKHMVMSFRVSELQVLLGFAGRNKSGRKQELLQRGLALVEKGAPTPIQIKIKDLYRRRFPPRQQMVVNPMQMVHGSSPVKQQPISLPGGASSMGDYRKMGSQRPPLPSLSIPDHNQVPVHPDVRFKSLPFYDVLSELLKPTSLANSGISRFQEASHIFHLTPQQTQEISSSRCTPDGQTTVQVQLRFCLMETTCPQEDNFPPSICVRVCGKMTPLPNPIPTNKPGVEPKRPSRPINITNLCRLSPIVANQVSVSWASDMGRSYCIGIFLVRKLNSDILLSRMKSSGTKHPDHTRALIKEKLALDADSEIATTSLRVSLQCPLGKMRMTVPSRASSCNHLQCFDAPMFLMMNEKKPTWTCPVCDKPAEYNKLVIDGLFTEILNSAPSECGEIEFTETGSWKPVRPKEKKPRAKSPTQLTRPAPPVEMIEDSPCPKKDSPKPSTSTSEAAPKPASHVMVDLTETDDEEDDDITQSIKPRNYGSRIPEACSPINLCTPESGKGPVQSNSSDVEKELNEAIDCMTVTPNKERRTERINFSRPVPLLYS